MKKGAGSNYQGMKNQRFIVRIVAVGCLAGFPHIDLNRMEM